MGNVLAVTHWNPTGKKKKKKRAEQKTERRRTGKVVLNSKSSKAVQTSFLVFALSKVFHLCRCSNSTSRRSSSSSNSYNNSSSSNFSSHSSSNSVVTTAAAVLTFILLFLGSVQVILEHDANLPLIGQIFDEGVSKQGVSGWPMQVVLDQAAVNERQETLRPVREGGRTGRRIVFFRFFLWLKKWNWLK